jgi:hypothetical protein
MRSAAALACLAALCAGCPGNRRGGAAEPPGDPYPGREQSLSGILLRELEVEVLEGLDLPTFETAVPPTAVSSRVGAVHIGVGPDDVTSPRPGSSGQVDRWPLLPVDEVGGRLDVAESKRLEMHLARDLTAAWTVDEVSYRIPGCLGRDGAYKVAVVPLRMTTLYVRDGERWVAVLEHLSYPQRIAELVERADKPRGKKLFNGRDPRPEIEGPIAVLRRAIDPDLGDEERAVVFASGRDALAIWPDPEQELRRGAVLSGASLGQVLDATSIELESWRVGMSPDPTGGVGGGSVAWLAGTLEVHARRADGDSVAAVPLRLRATFVLEQREVAGAMRWQVVQSHVSAPIDDTALMAAVMGTSAVEGDSAPWQRPCEGAWRAPEPATPLP